MSALERWSEVESSYRSCESVVARSLGSVGAMDLTHASAVGPHLPPTSRTNGMRRGSFWYLARFCCSRSVAAVALVLEREVVRTGQLLTASVTLMSMRNCRSSIVV